MKILALVGSPRKGGNTDILVDRFLEGAERNGHASEKIYLYDYTFTACIACSRCKEGNHVCTVRDEMQDIYPKIDASDLIVFGTPNYWFGPSGKMKSLFDRLRPYTANKKIAGKDAVLIVAAADGPEACKPIVEMFRMSFDYLKIDFKGHVLGTAYEMKEILNDEEALAEASNLGISL